MKKNQDLNRYDASKVCKRHAETYGKIAALGRFMSRSIDRSLPFFNILKNFKNFKWTDECQKSFEGLKE